MVVWAIGIDVHRDKCTAKIACAEYGKSSKMIDEFTESFNKRFRRFSTGAPEFLKWRAS